MAHPQQELWVTRLGLIDYDEALGLQNQLRDARAQELIPDTLLLLEHPPIYTRGRRSEDSELPMGAGWYAEQGIEIRDVNRGGKVTYHGPGQLVGYPILNTKIVKRDVPKLVSTLEQSIIGALFEEGVVAHPDPAGRGVWAGEGAKAGKIGSIGLHVSEGITTHGFAVNVDNDLQPFTWIKPCGLDDAATSIAELTGNAGRMRCFSKRTAFALATRLGLRQRLVSRTKLEAAIEPARAQLVSAT